MHPLAPRAASGAASCDQGATATPEDARDYIASVRERQASLDAASQPRDQPAKEVAQAVSTAAALDLPDGVAVARLRAVQTAGAATLTAISQRADGGAARSEALATGKGAVPALHPALAPPCGSNDSGRGEPGRGGLGLCGAPRAALSASPGGDTQLASPPPSGGDGSPEGGAALGVLPPLALPCVPASLGASPRPGHVRAAIHGPFGSNSDETVAHKGVHVVGCGGAGAAGQVAAVGEAEQSASGGAGVLYATAAVCPLDLSSLD